MAESNNTSLQNVNAGSVIPFDQPEIEAVMKQILYENGITDVLYEGSNISQLTSVISYVISTLNINTAINIQETILPLATKRMNVLFGARQLGYEPTPPKSYIYEITISAKYDETKKVPGVNGALQTDYNNTETRSIKLSKNTAFESNGKTYYYLGPDIDNFFNCSNFDITYPDQATNVTKRKIVVKEGKLITHDGANNTESAPSLSFYAKEYVDTDGKRKVEQEFLIPFHNVEADGIQVVVDNIDYSGVVQNGVYPHKQQTYTKSPSYLIDESFEYGKNVFIRQENIILQYPVIFFEYAGMGTPLQQNDLVLVNVLQTSGADGVATGTFRFKDPAASELMEVLPNSAVLLQMGSSAESNESIQKNAPTFNNTANRAVTKLDYQAIARKWEIGSESTDIVGLPISRKIIDAEAWGGEEEINPSGNFGGRFVGHVWTSVLPETETEYQYTEANTNPITLESYDLLDAELNTDKSNLEKWYLSEKEIHGNHTGPDNERYNGFLDYLDYYKVITLKMQYRHPLYVDFTFECDIVKYDLTKSTYEVNNTVFNKIRSFFESYLSRFGVEYVNSNLQRELDSAITYESGIGYTVQAQGVLFKDQKDQKTGFIHFSLAFPFENMFTQPEPGGSVSTGWLDVNLLPNIDTTDFGVANGTLLVDYAALSGMNLGLSSMSADITYNGTVVGSYEVDKEFDIINVKLDLPDEVFIDSSTGQESYARFDLNYPFSTNYNYNIPFAKNTIPRLKQVRFLKN